MARLGPVMQPSAPLVSRDAAGEGGPFLRRRLAVHLAQLQSMLGANTALPAGLRPSWDTRRPVVAVRGVWGPATAARGHVCLVWCTPRRRAVSGPGRVGPHTTQVGVAFSSHPLSPGRLNQHQS